MTTRRTGLREQKKRATEEALREAALRLALQRGPDNVRVDDIADAAGVSPRTYNNYFSSREQAIVAAVTAERETRVAAAVTGRDAGTGLADAVTDAIVEQYTGTDANHDAMAVITASPALREAYLHAATAIEDPLATAIAHRLGGAEAATAGVLAAAITAAVRTALRQWLQPAPGGLVVPAGSLADRFRAALAVLAPALDAAEEQHRRPR